MWFILLDFVLDCFPKPALCREVRLMNLCSIHFQVSRTTYVAWGSPHKCSSLQPKGPDPTEVQQPSPSGESRRGARIHQHWRWIQRFQVLGCSTIQATDAWFLSKVSSFESLGICAHHEQHSSPPAPRGAKAQTSSRQLFGFICLSFYC